MAKELNALALGGAGAVISAACMLLLGILAPLGVYTNMAQMMGQWHMFFSLSAIGVITGMVEAAALSFVFLYVLAWLYNQWA